MKWNFIYVCVLCAKAYIIRSVDVAVWRESLNWTGSMKCIYIIHHSETSKSNESERFNEKSYLHSSTLKTTYFIVIWWQLIILNHKWSHQSLKFSSETFSMLYVIHYIYPLVANSEKFPNLYVQLQCIRNIF